MYYSSLSIHLLMDIQVVSMFWYYKLCCNKHWGTCVFFSYGFLRVYTQQWDCWVIVLLLVCFKEFISFFFFVERCQASLIIGKCKLKIQYDIILHWLVLVAQSCPTVTRWTAAHQAHLSMRFSRQRYWSGLPFPSPGNIPNPGIKPRSPALQADFLSSVPRHCSSGRWLKSWKSPPLPQNSWNNPPTHQHMKLPSL